MSNTHRLNVTCTRLAVLAGLCWAAGCTEPAAPGGPEHYEQALALLLPQRIQIQPFTRIASFDDDEVPDGISVYLRPVDQFGDPVKVAGTFLFELYRYRQASADRKGERLEFWETRILDENDQRRYWDHTSQMYEFPLEIQQLRTEEGRPILSRDKAVLLVTFNTPRGEHLESEYILEAKRPRTEQP